MVGYSSGVKSPDVFGTFYSSPACGSTLQESIPLNPPCPQCNSKRLWRDSKRYTAAGNEIQRWLCRECGLRFSDPNDIKKAGAAVATVERIETKLLKSANNNFSTTQICVKETKNLDAEQQTTGVLRSNNQADIKGKIVEHAFWMQKEGYAEATISRRIRFLKTMMNKGANLADPESLKEMIARQQNWQVKTKDIAVETYSLFLKMQGMTWNPPKFKSVKKLPFIPTEQEINSLIAGSNRKTSTFLQLLKETGMRCGEAYMLKWSDFNFENRSVDITPEKGSEPRQLPISNQLIAMLNSLPRDHEQPYKCSERHFARAFRLQRSRIAFNLKNDRLKKIHFHTFRHWKATTEYAKTKDILHVMKLLGHKNIQNTLLYTQLITFKNDEFHSATAKTVEDAQKLVEAGFDYVCDFGELKLFRKRK
jgi:integrase